MLSAFIPDGYNLDGFIEGAEGCYPSVAFEYRPIRIYDRSKMSHAIVHNPEPGSAEMIASEELAKQLISWDITTPDGEPVEINQQNILRLHPRVYSKLFDIVMGATASDTKKYNEKN